MKPKTKTNPKGGGRPGFANPTQVIQISGLNDDAIAHLKTTNASKYIRELIHADLANQLQKETTID